MKLQVAGLFRQRMCWLKFRISKSGLRHGFEWNGKNWNRNFRTGSLDIYHHPDDRLLANVSVILDAEICKLPLVTLANTIDHELTLGQVVETDGMSPIV